jgi:hypothetical protein
MLRGQGRCVQVKIMISTREGYTKDQSDKSKKDARERDFRLFFSGNNAPVKAIKAMMEKFGVRKEDI